MCLIFENKKNSGVQNPLEKTGRNRKALRVGKINIF
jgi:hypothetical protein